MRAAVRSADPRTWLLATILLAASVSAPRSVIGQTCTGNGRYVVHVRPTTISVPTPTAADFDTGWIAADPAQVRVNPRGSKNRGWELCLRAEGPTMGGSKPISDFQFRREGSTTWTPLTMGDQLLASGEKGRWVNLEFRVLLDWSRDLPATYRADFIATAAGDR